MPMLIPCGEYASVNAISACRVSRIRSICSAAVVTDRLATCRFGTIMRGPLLYGYRFRMAEQAAVRMRTRSSREGSALAQKIQPSSPPLVPATYFSLQGAQRCSTGKLKVRSEKSKVEIHEVEFQLFAFCLLSFNFLRRR